MDNHTDSQLKNPATAEIQLLSISRLPDESGRLAVAFVDVRRGGEFRLDCRPSRLQTFTAFQRYVASKLGIWITNFCQRLPARDGRWYWQFEEVSSAFEIGAAI